MQPTIRDMLPQESDVVAELVRQVFDTHVAPGYDEQGTREFHDYCRAEAIERRTGSGESWVLLAHDEGVLVGAIEVRDGDHVSLLFVSSKYQRRGIARHLYASALNRMVVTRPGLGEVTVNASPNAVLAYGRLGFRVVQHEQVVNGIRFVSMIHDLGHAVDEA